MTDRITAGSAAPRRVGRAYAGNGPNPSTSTRASTNPSTSTSTRASTRHAARPHHGIPAAGGRLATAFLAITLLSACASASDEPAAEAADRLPVVASTSVWGNIAQQIGGDHVTVQSIIDDPSQDPHSYQASGRDELALSKASVVIVNGGGYDDAIAAMAEKSGDDVDLITAVDAAPSLRQDGADGEFNEHIWYSLTGVSEVAGDIADAFAARDPNSASVFQENLEDFRESLRSLQDSEQAIATAHSGARVLVTEPLPDYLIDDTALDNVTPPEFSESVEEGISVSPSLLNTVLDLVDDSSLAAVFVTEQTTGPESTRIIAAADSAGVPTISVSEILPKGEQYQEWMRATIESVAAALHGEGGE